LELSLAETPKNENLLIAACHFWSNGFNAFLFGHGPMSPTLANVYMMTGLEFLKPREKIIENIQGRRVFEYKCSPTIYTWLFIPTTIAHPLFISWWQEFHDHIFNEPVHSFCLELMPDFQPTSEVTHLSFL
jgi:hypothetical protein